MDNGIKTIRLCLICEVDKLQGYLKDHWKSNHILVQSTELLLWQHAKNKSELNYVIALNTSEQIVGVLGFIPTSKFDESISLSKAEIWLALWKANDEYRGAGFYMLRFLEEQFYPVSIGVIGINETVAKLYKSLGYNIVFWEQYYYLNPGFKEFEIIKPSCTDRTYTTTTLLKSTIKEIENLYELENPPDSIYKPFKSIDYFINRYVCHPFYKYRFLGIFTSSSLVSMLVVRKIEENGATCLRIIDVLGDLSKIDCLSTDLDKLLEKENAEYIDFVNFGIAEETFFKMGLKKRQSDMIIPNYFEPFLRENVDVKCAYKNNGEDYVIFKGDGDQDRPNFL